ncbi:NAD(P)/FAD-dependent oxidoreductase [Actinoplanes sp. NPDC051633]|uniref:flavin-containing monooxygenase n=1 Tax=Actinoplanes sp. NPDC051633 TaxID=3155670 RepID=UPI00342EFD41
MDVACVVVGGGPAGLAASAALTDRDVEHVVLERGRPGQTWRSQRWDSFRLNTPGWANALLGDQDRDAFLTAAEVVRRLDRLAAACPVRAGVEVHRLVPHADGFVLDTGAGRVRSRAVVVATGGENVPRLPTLARKLCPQVAQLHAADYREPAELPAGAVLVVGSGQSGCQIAEDLVLGGRRVILATSPVGRVPWRYRGRDTQEWLFDAGFFHQRINDLPDPALAHVPRPIFGSGGRSLSLQSLARAGVTLTGRMTAVADHRITVDDSLADNVAAGDAFAARARAMVDDIIRRDGIDAPTAEPDATDGAVDLPSTTAVDLLAEGVGSVVWCTGFTGDFSWLSHSLLNGAGHPAHSGPAAATVTGLWYLGLHWLTHRSSDTLNGMPRDAARVADAVRAHLDHPHRP